MNDLQADYSCDIMVGDENIAERWHPTIYNLTLWAYAADDQLRMCPYVQTSTAEHHDYMHRHTICVNERGTIEREWDEYESKDNVVASIDRV